MAWRNESAGKGKMTGIHPGLRAQFRQDFGMNRLESSSSDCSMGAGFRETSVNSVYTQETLLTGQLYRIIYRLNFGE